MSDQQEAQVVRTADRTRQRINEARALLYNVRDPKKYPEFDRVEREVLQAVVSLRLRTLCRSLDDVKGLLAENKRLSKELRVMVRQNKPKPARKPRVAEAAKVIRRIAQRSSNKITQEVT